MNKWRWVPCKRIDPCPICKKPDYCTYCPELGLALCMRVSSDRPSKCSMGGWLHKLNGEQPYIPPSKPEPPKPKLNVTRLMAEWLSQTEPQWVIEEAASLGVSYESLLRLGCVWVAEKRSWGFPMFDGYGEPVGIRLRTSNGRKFAVYGSHNGIFIPKMEPQRTVFVPEGVTDCAACITLGFFTIARPSNNGCLHEVVTACKRLGVQRVVIVADNDKDREDEDGEIRNPGIDGSLALQKLLPIPSVIFIPCAKDFRAALKLGMTKEIIEQTVKNLVWHQPHLDSIHSATASAAAK